ncbi:MAG: ABC transporter ATP-binding protein [Clostridia bacterium]|nr:ABC transporter ATP-binding protein [Clostridia bacterium]MBQ2152878.1 ABC transporter ATP-binding protein [Clostridia bacterium]MBQ2348825.1 ABC transporter ATP-binding protein [Clostridia bacterium]MBQ5440558.1 ABC transporter ATP-binding protein [Clostridia bacterium]
MILTLNGIYKNYLTGSMEVPVLKDINLSVEEGDYLAIMGPSGSGKSTLMNIIGCLDKPTSGQYLFDGVDISRQNDAALSKIRNSGIGFVFQNFNLLPRQTALENVELPLLYANVRKKKRREIAAQALEKVGLADRMNFLPTQLSGGQKQRVAIARAIANKPKILLADEPTGALDSKSGDQVMELFSQLNSEGMTIVMITHEKAVAECANKTIVIYDGEIKTMEEFESILNERRNSRGDDRNG